MLDAIRTHPGAMKPLFVKQTEVISLQKFTDMLSVDFSKPGSNVFVQEQESYAIFLDFVEELHSKLIIIIQLGYPRLTYLKDCSFKTHGYICWVVCWLLGIFAHQHKKR